MRKLPLVTWVVVPLAGALANVALNAVNRGFQSPLFFDSILTAVVSAVWGPGPGVLTAVLTQLGMEGLLSLSGAGGTALPFVTCGLATALIVGLLARGGRFAKDRHLVVAVVLVTLANAALGAMTAALVFGGITLHDSDFLITSFRMVGQSLLEAAFWARIPLNLVDKGLAVALAFWAAHAARSRLPQPSTTP